MNFDLPAVYLKIDASLIPFSPRPHVTSVFQILISNAYLPSDEFQIKNMRGGGVTAKYVREHSEVAESQDFTS